MELFSAVFVLVCGTGWLSGCDAGSLWYNVTGPEGFPITVEEVDLKTGADEDFGEVGAAEVLTPSTSAGPPSNATDLTVLEGIQTTTEPPPTTLDQVYVIESVLNPSNNGSDFSENDKNRKSNVMSSVLIILLVGVVATELLFILSERYCRIKCCWDASEDSLKKNVLSEEYDPFPESCNSTVPVHSECLRKSNQKYDVEVVLHNEEKSSQELWTTRV